MAILINNLNMPKNCDECIFLDELGDYPTCNITKDSRGYNFRTRDIRMNSCPLKEIPEKELKDICPLCEGFNKKNEYYWKSQRDTEDVHFYHIVTNYCPYCGKKVR